MLQTADWYQTMRKIFHKLIGNNTVAKGLDLLTKELPEKEKSRLKTTLYTQTVELPDRKSVV